MTNVGNAIMQNEGTIAVQSDSPQPASDHTRRMQADAAQELPWCDSDDFDLSLRGFVGTIDGPVSDERGETVLDLPAYEFLDGDAPDSVHPSLWRLAKLNARHGLFEVAPGIHQVRNLDISNLTVIRGAEGIIVVDPLYSRETATEAMRLVRRHLGDLPVTGIIITHSHLDHFGGIDGVLPPECERAGGADVPIIAPAGFMANALSENLSTGVIEGRRNQYMFGTTLPRDARGQVTSSLGIATSTGVSTIRQPNVLVGPEGAVMDVDGVKFVFHDASGAEAPSEFHFVIPDRRAACLAENLSRVMHNIYTLRGAQVRDALLWSKYIDRAIDDLSDDVDVVFMGHHWPVWGTGRIRDFLEKQRDMYRFLHDETVRLMNHGYSGAEIAEVLTLPDDLAKFWPNRGNYGTLSHNVKAIYQRYLGWFDGNPANLHPLPPKALGVNYVDAMGGVDRVVDMAHAASERGEYRWAAELLKHVIAARPDNAAAKSLQASVFEQLGYQAESGPWRNFYLTGAQELRGLERNAGMAPSARSRELVRNVPIDDLIDFLGLRFKGGDHAGMTGVLRLVVDDVERFIVVKHGCLHGRTGLRHGEHVDSTLTMTRDQFSTLCQGAEDLDDAQRSDRVVIGGDESFARTFWSALDRFTGEFLMTEPRI
ncbi:MAG: alkyl/aryl-sulfatase [Pseudoclavibacter sp.]